MNHSNNLQAQALTKAFASLSEYLLLPSPELTKAIDDALQANAWFTRDNVNYSLLMLAESIKEKKIQNWFGLYYEMEEKDRQPKMLKCGLILAGNIPAVGFQDVLAVLASGNMAMIKLSSQDNVLIPFLLKKLIEFEPIFRNRFTLCERLAGFDTVIATGSNNSSRYFEYYFAKVPHIIRKNRNSIAVLTGNESTEELSALGKDIFMYFGLGCRNISKLLVPKDYKFGHFFESIESWHSITNFHKYAHNYDYQLTISMINRLNHYTNGFIVLNENPSLHSPIASLNFSRYDSVESAIQELSDNRENIQCTCSIDPNIPGAQGFGTTQSPEIWDYADKIDVMRFLLDLQSSVQ